MIHQYVFPRKFDKGSSWGFLVSCKLNKNKNKKFISPGRAGPTNDTCPLYYKAGGIAIEPLHYRSGPAPLHTYSGGVIRRGGSRFCSCMVPQPPELQMLTSHRLCVLVVGFLIPPGCNAAPIQLKRSTSKPLVIDGSVCNGARPAIG